MPDGFHYLQKHVVNGVLKDIRIDGGSYEELIANVQDWRVHNKVDVGDVISDVTKQICERFPRQCEGSGHIVNQVIGGPIAPQGVKRFVDYVLSWMREVSVNPESKKIESQSEADRRGKICVECKENSSDIESACPVCVEHARRAGTLLRQNRQSAYHEKLIGCRILKHDNATAVFMNQGVLPPADGVPANCWRKK